jgi:hypothetical protein
MNAELTASAATVSRSKVRRRNLENAVGLVMIAGSCCACATFAIFGLQLYTWRLGDFQQQRSWVVGQFEIHSQLMPGGARL